MPARARSEAANVVMSRPSQVMEPDRTRSSPMMARSSDDLPTPLRPSTVVTLPGSACSDTPRRQWLAP